MKQCHIFIGARRHGNFAHNICPSRRAFLETLSGALIGDFRRVPTTIRRFPATTRLILFLVKLILFFAKFIPFFAKLILFFTKYFADLSRLVFAFLVFVILSSFFSLLAADLLVLGKGLKVLFKIFPPFIFCRGGRPIASFSSLLVTPKPCFVHYAEGMARTKQTADPTRLRLREGASTPPRERYSSTASAVDEEFAELFQEIDEYVEAGEQAASSSEGTASQAVGEPSVAPLSSAAEEQEAAPQLIRPRGREEAQLLPSEIHPDWTSI
ncbi:uncharacterized protein [Spinacia oleracea]|uniref:Uncharacterized protein n=1 Tax=Spinacia oleracea TaxID=3562 RepID=A0ABM3QPX4_SPIOL|nr:uncharacterized protein LOC130461361 [Spinacia oleracea]